MIHHGHTMKCHISLFGFGWLTGKLCSRQAGRVSCSEEPADSPSWSLISSAGQEPPACLGSVLFTASLLLLFCPPHDKALTVLPLWIHVVPSICSSASGAWLLGQTRTRRHWWTRIKTSPVELNLQSLCFKAVAALVLYYTHAYIFVTHWNAVFCSFSSECTYRNLLKASSAFL